MPRNSFLVFGSPSIEEDEIQEMVDCLRSGWIGSGPRVEKFEQVFRDYVGADHALAVSSCAAHLPGEMRDYSAAGASGAKDQGREQPLARDAGGVYTYDLLSGARGPGIKAFDAA